MELNEHIEYWINTSNNDFEVFEVLLNNKKYLHALFIAHLSLEKLIKAQWVKDYNNSVPPKIHNLITLIKQTSLELEHEQLVFLTLMNDFQIQGRYPDYKIKIHQLLTDDFVNDIYMKYKEIRECLLQKIV